MYYIYIIIIYNYIYTYVYVIVVIIIIIIIHHLSRSIIHTLAKPEYRDIWHHFIYVHDIELILIDH